jgi:hypothetical protein
MEKTSAIALRFSVDQQSATQLQGYLKNLLVSTNQQQLAMVKSAAAAMRSIQENEAKASIRVQETLRREELKTEEIRMKGEARVSAEVAKGQKYRIQAAIQAREAAEREYDKEAKAAESSFKKTLDSWKKTEQSMKPSAASGRSAGGFGSGLVTAAGVGAGIVAVEGARASINLIKESKDAYRDYVEEVNKGQVVFGKASDAVREWSKTSATSLGLSQTAALQASSDFGNLFQQLEKGPQETAEMSKKVVQLAADLASFHNIKPEEALVKLRAGLVGEMEPLRTLGVHLDDATLRIRAMNMGLMHSTKEVLPPQIKMMAAYEEIFSQTSKAQGDFARTSNEVANAERVMAAETENLKKSIGEKLLPIWKTMIGQGQEWVTIMGEAGKATDEALKNRTAPQWLQTMVENWREVYLHAKETAALNAKTGLQENTSANRAASMRGDYASLAAAADDLQSGRRKSFEIDPATQSLVEKYGVKLPGGLASGKEMYDAIARARDNARFQSDMMLKQSRIDAGLQARNVTTQGRFIESGGGDSGATAEWLRKQRAIDAEKARKEKEKADKKHQIEVDKAQREAERQAEINRQNAEEVKALDQDTDKTRIGISSSGYQKIFDAGIGGIRGLQSVNPNDLRNASRNLYNNDIISADHAYSNAVAPQEGDTPEKVKARVANAQADFDKARMDAQDKRDKRLKEIEDALVEAKQKQLKLMEDEDNENLRAEQEYFKQKEQERKDRAEAAKDYLDAEKQAIEAALTEAEDRKDFTRQRQLVLLRAQNKIEAALPDLYSGLMAGDNAALMRGMAVVADASHEAGSANRRISEQSMSAASHNWASYKGELSGTAGRAGSGALSDLIRNGGRGEGQIAKDALKDVMEESGKYLATSLRSNLSHYFDGLGKNFAEHIKLGGASAAKSLQQGALAIAAAATLANPKTRKGGIIGGIVGGIAGSLLPGGWLMGAEIGSAIGGQLGFADGGFPPSGRSVLVGELGPELVSLPPGSQVHNAAHTRAMMGAGGGGSGGSGIHIHGPLMQVDAIHSSSDWNFYSSRAVDNLNSLLQRG